MPDNNQRKVRVGMVVGRSARASLVATESPCAWTTDISALRRFSRKSREILAAAGGLSCEDRVYSDYGAMAEAESKREDGIDAVADRYADR